MPADPELLTSLTNRVDEETLRSFLAERIAAFKVPVKILFSPDMLPRNPNGKIIKNELKPLFADYAR
jgi:long-chain acyl-CoA synthetase